MINQTFADIRNDVLADLAGHQLETTTDALNPLRRIDWKKLVTIHDHEEHFLRTVFVSSLTSVYQARVASGAGTAKINQDDVRTAMLMLGSAVANAAEKVFSAKNKSIIKTVCPYC